MSSHEENWAKSNVEDARNWAKREMPETPEGQAATLYLLGMICEELHRIEVAVSGTLSGSTDTE